MSMFDGLVDAMASVPSTELRFSFAELECLINSINHYQSYLDDREADEQPPVYASDGSPMMDIISSLWVKIFKYQFH